MSNGLNLPFAGTISNNQQAAFSVTNTGDPRGSAHPKVVAVEGSAPKGIAISGTSQQATGVTGESQTGSGVAGNSNSGVGVFGSSQAGDGVVGLSTSSAHAGVSATNDSGGFGVWGRGTPGGHFESNGSDGVVGLCTSSAHAGVSATNDSGGFGVWGRGTPGGFFESNGSDGVVGLCASNAHAGVSATNDSGGSGVWARGTPAGYFVGDVEVTGTATIDGDIRLPGADCAEQFDVADAHHLEPGTVVVIDEEGALHESSEAYDRKVAGVVSGAGEYRPGIVLGGASHSEDRALVAMIGKVYCKVDARVAPIELGDLLTTSPTPGHAMRADDPARAFGAVIGKALRPMSDGCGLIPMLVALQ